MEETMNTLVTARDLVKQFPLYAEGTLANMRHRRTGPPFYKQGKRVFYDPREFEAWIRKGRIVTRG